MSDLPRIRIRTALDDDLPSLEWEGQYSHYRKAYQRAMKEAEAGRRVLMVAEVGGQVVGQLFIVLAGGHVEYADGVASGYLYAFRVRPSYRNQGIGTQLIREAERILLERGFVRAVIAVSKDNAKARRLYERLGYQVFSEDPGLWSFVDHQGRLRSVEEPAFLLQKRIAP